MDDLPKVSVVIPSYNRAGFICETVDSVLSQTYKNLEVIVVDDGSTDDTLEMLKKYNQKIKVLQHSDGVNKGQSAAINLGMKHAQGEYIAILDSDDLFAPEKIELQVDFLEQNPEIGLVYANGEAIDENGRPLYLMFPSGHQENNEGLPEKILLDCYFNVPSNALVRREAFEKVGSFDESLRSAQDHDMAIRLAEVTRLGYIDKVLWRYRRHPETQSGRFALRRWRLGFKILKKAVRRYPYNKIIVRKRRAVLHFRLGQCYYKNARFFRAIFHYIMAGLLDPVRALGVLAGRETIVGSH